MSGWSNNRPCGPSAGVLSVLFGLSVLLGLSTGCAKREPAAPARILRISQRNEPATLDPHLATLPDEFFVLRALSEGLVTPNPDGGTLLPGVAERWEASDDGLTWTFHLRADAKWSNGDPVTAEDFAWSIRRAIDPKTASPKAALFFPLRGAREVARGTADVPTLLGVQAADARTLVLTLARPAPDLPALAACGSWLPVHRGTVEKHGRRWTHPGNFVGNGPFVLAAWIPNQRIVVRRNPLYWDAPTVQLSAVHFLAFDSGDTEERAFRAGQVDVTLAVPAAKLEGYRRQEPSALQTTPLYETRFLVVNTRRGPLADPRVRRALSLALDRPALVDKVLKAGQRPALNFVPTGLGGYSPHTLLAEDAGEARRLLAGAGYPEGRGFPALELSAWPVATAQLEAIQQMWRDRLGITVTIAQREAKTHLAALAAGDFDLGYYTAIPDYDGAGDLLARLTTGSTDNYTGWSDPEFDRLVAAGGPALRAAEARLLDMMPVIPLYLNTKTFLLRPVVRGWREDALWTRYYKHVTVGEP